MSVFKTDQNSLLNSPQISCDQVSLKWPQGVILNPISFDLDPGEMVALIGPNGAGKSSLLRRMAGLEPPLGGVELGCVRIQGKRLDQISGREKARLVTYLSDEFSSEFDLTVEQAVALGRLNYGNLPSSSENAPTEHQQIIHKALEDCQLTHLKDRVLRSLSGGERQLAGLACALAQQTPVLLLDESLSKMDLNHQLVMGKLLQRRVREQGVTVILVSHDLNVASEWADSVILLKEGQMLAHGKLHEHFTQEALLRLYPGLPLILVPHPVSGAPKVFLDSKK